MGGVMVLADGFAGSVLADGFSDPEKGPGGTWGLLAGLVAIYLIWRFDKWRQDRKAGREGAPPPEPEPSTSARRALPPSAPEPVADDGPLPWYGRIVRGADGAVRRIKHVAATGDSPPPVLETGAEPGVDPVDVDLGEPAALPVEPYVPPAGPNYVKVDVPPRRPSAEAYIDQCVRKGVDKAAIVEGLMQHYGMARATAYRRVGHLGGRSRKAA